MAAAYVPQHALSLEAPGRTALSDCELGAIDLYDADGFAVSRVALAGGHDWLAIDLAHVIPRILAIPCRSVILSHSHASGQCLPSEADIAATRAFAGMLHLMALRLHDHLVLGRTGSFSFRAEGLL